MNNIEKELDDIKKSINAVETGVNFKTKVARYNEVTDKIQKVTTYINELAKSLNSNNNINDNKIISDEEYPQYMQELDDIKKTIISKKDNIEIVIALTKRGQLLLDKCEEYLKSKKLSIINL